MIWSLRAQEVDLVKVDLQFVWQGYRASLVLTKEPSRRIEEVELREL
jgi:hypothetical protein